MRFIRLFALISTAAQTTRIRLQSEVRENYGALRKLSMKQAHPDSVKIGMTYGEVLEILGKDSIGEKKTTTKPGELWECGFSFAHGAWACILYFDEKDHLKDKSIFCIR